MNVFLLLILIFIGAIQIMRSRFNANPSWAGQKVVYSDLRHTVIPGGTLNVLQFWLFYLMSVKLFIKLK
jgi:hypothetical protein